MAQTTALSERVLDALGFVGTLEELTKALSQKEYDECMEYIARMNDITLSEEEMEEMAEYYEKNDRPETDEEVRLSSGYKDAEQTAEWAGSQGL